jgi:sugar O-acyltransferase (sialic acid O-acetyltransferase NeuD family)
MINIVLVGGGGHCKSTIEVIETHSELYSIKGILDSNEKGSIFDYPILGNDDLIPELAKDCNFIITVGNIKTTKIREKIAANIKEHNGKLITVISNNAVVSKNSTIGAGTVVYNNANVNADSKIGENCILNTACNIEHDCIIGDFVHVSTGAMINGGCSIGNRCFIGSNATIMNGISISDDVIVGAGSVVVKNIIDSGVYVGNPAKKIQ